jgi:2-polyprenyl-3-methyl-5-hydroxy-6-metoxy-1,4-benzoquinol methylase
LNIEAVDELLYVEITIDDRFAARLLCADRIDYRNLELEEADLPGVELKRINRTHTVSAGFSYRVPTIFAPPKLHSVKVFSVVSEHKELIWEDTTNFAEIAIGELKGLFAEYTYIAFENFRYVPGQGRGTVVAQGWITAPDDRVADRIAGCSVHVNETPFETTTAPLPEPPDTLHFTFAPERPTFSFTVTADLGRIAPEARGYRFSCRDEEGERITPEALDFFLPTNWQTMLTEKPLPSLEGIRRTTPAISRRASAERDEFVPSRFHFGGYTDMCQIERAIRLHANRDFDGIHRVLDWGCGCGRLTYHLGSLPGILASGIDMDFVNIKWASQNIRTADFSTAALDPPLPFEDETFDLIIGLSVFTHLTEADQFAWLEEHRRILKQGGILAATVHGTTSLKCGGLRKLVNDYRALEVQGICDSRIANKFKDLLKDRPTYYRQTRHRPDYVRHQWGRYFDIVGVEPGGAAGQQDLVIAAKRS